MVRIERNQGGRGHWWSKWKDSGAVGKDELTSVFPEGLPEGGDENVAAILPQLHENKKAEPKTASGSVLVVLKSGGETLDVRPAIEENEVLTPEGAIITSIGGVHKDGTMTKSNKLAQKLGK